MSVPGETGTGTESPPRGVGTSNTVLFRGFGSLPDRLASGSNSLPRSRCFRALIQMPRNPSMNSTGFLHGSPERYSGMVWER